MKCNSCGGKLNERDIFLLKSSNVIYCRFCGVPIILNDENEILTAENICAICGSILNADQMIGETLVCLHCGNTLKQILNDDSYYPSLFETLKEIPEEKIIEIHNLLTNEEYLQEFPEEDRIEVKAFGEKLLSYMAMIYKLDKWELAKTAISFLGNGIGFSWVCRP